MSLVRPPGRVLLRRLLIFGLVTACFAVVLANRVVTSGATAGFEVRIAGSLHNEAVLTFPLLAAQTVSRGHADASHIDPYMEHAIRSAVAGEGVTFSSFSRQFVRLAEAHGDGQVEILTTDPAFLAAWQVEPRAGAALFEGGCLAGGTLAQSLADPLPQWLHFGNTRCVLSGIFDATARPPFWTLDRAILRLAAPGQAMAGETIVWSGYLRAEAVEFGEDRLREGLRPWIDDAAVEIWSSRDQAARAAEILAIYRFVAGAISGIALGICAFAIATTFMFSVAGQRREIAILRALGATQWRIMANVLTEVAVLVGAALAIGLIAGRMLGWFLLRHMSGTGLLEISPSSALSPEYLTGLAALFLMTGLGAGLIPAITAARIDPAIVLRGD